MRDSEILHLIETEFKEKSFAVTEQYLKIHSPLYHDGNIKIDRIDRENVEYIIAYLPVFNELFHFAIYFDLLKKEIVGIGTEAFYKVYFRATSEILSVKELKQMTTLNFYNSWNKGDFRFNKETKYSFSNIEIQPNPEPDEFEDKIVKLLDYLENDTIGIKNLVKKADGYVQVFSEIHNGNGLLGGFNLNQKIIQRMEKLNLSINFDFQASGNKFIDE